MEWLGVWNCIFSADCKRGRKKGAARKWSKSFEKLFDTFWRFLTFFALRENCRKVSKNFLTLFDDFWRFLMWPLSAGPFCNPLIFSGSEFSNFGAGNLAKIALSAVFPGFGCKFRPLKNIFPTLENGHSIRHQPIPPLVAGRINSTKIKNCGCNRLR